MKCKDKVFLGNLQANYMLDRCREKVFHCVAGVIKEMKIEGRCY